MKSAKLFSHIIWVLVVMLLGTGSVSVLTSCASSSKSESTGQYVDDSSITAKVKAKIFENKNLSVNDIGVETYKGVVQLSGFVDNAEKVKEAGDLAASVPGVVSVKNDLIVK